MARIIKRAYADTSAGQVHYRDAGQGTPVILLHFAPGCGRQFEAVLPILAERGYRTIAPDLMGYGDSDKPEFPWKIEDYARNLAEMLDDLGLDSVPIVGGHTSAAVVTELAVTRPERVARLVLDGCPIYTAEEQAERYQKYALPMELSADGAHLLWAWQRSFRRPTMPLERVFASTLDLLKAGFTWHLGYDAVFSYDMAARMPLISCPTLVLSATEDPLFPVHEQTLRLLQHGSGHIFPGRAPLADPARAGEWVDAVDPFLEAVER